MIQTFNFAKIPEIEFGVGKIKLLYEKITQFGNRIILLTSGGSLIKTERFDNLLLFFKKKSIQYLHHEISGEPSPEMINNIIRDIDDTPVDVVISIGGGSVLDAGKAVSAMLGKNDPVEYFLEGVGTKSHDGSKIPFIAVPTTSGTGSEATKNAVLSQVGASGFKKSLRHNNFVPDIAIVDPELTVSCPADVTAACGLDAFTQLLESYVSTGASPMTDSLAYSGINLLKDSLIPAATTASQDLDHRSAMSYAALMSGITLANAGLGIVHGLASPIGSYYDIPHGVVCGTLVGEATKINIEKLRQSGQTGLYALGKHAEIGELLSGDKCQGTEACCDFLVNKIEEWIDLLAVPKLRAYGIRESDVDKIVAEADIKNNPVQLEKEDVKKIVLERI
jgi:alcohol dehydrogenase class IV